MKSAFFPRFFVDHRAFGGIPEPQGTRPRLRELPPSAVGAEAELASEDAHHARIVLRARTGDECEVVPEPYRVVCAAILEVTGEKVVVRIERVLEEGPEEPFIVLVQGLPQPRQVDVLVEKGTEVGIDEFVLTRAAGSPAVPVDRLEKRLDRWTRIAREAAKQSRQFSVPRISIVGSMEGAFGWIRETGIPSVIMHPDGDPGSAWSLDQMRRGAVRGEAGGFERRLALWVGPEGGWSEEEIAFFRERDAPILSLGYRVLRTETAGPVAAAIVRFTLSHR